MGNILAIDDDREILKTIKRALESQEHQVFCHEKTKGISKEELLLKYNILLALCVICDFACVVFALNLQNQKKIFHTTSDSWTIFLFAGLLFFEALFILLSESNTLYISQAI